MPEDLIIPGTEGTQDNPSVDPAASPEGNIENPEGEEVTYTQAELDSQVSKSVAAALERQEKKNQAALNAAVAKALEEAEARAKMSEEERISADLKAREEALAQREAEAERREFLAEVTAELAREGIPVSFAELIVNSSDRDSAAERIQEVKEEWESALTERVKAGARQTDPKAPSGTPNEGTVDLAAFAAKNRKI